jgi:hypothetical protein
MTGATFLAYCKSVIKRTDKDDSLYLCAADTVMDMRARMLSDEHETISAALTGIAAAGDYILTLPTDFGHLVGDVSIRNTGDDSTYLPLMKLTKAEYDKKYSQNLATAVANRVTGTPIDYCYFGNKIYLGPAVDTTAYEFKINYTTESEPTFTAVTATIPFTEQFREVVRAGTVARMFRELENYVESDQWFVFYEQGLKKIIDNDEFNKSGSVVNVQYSGF